MKQLAAAVMLFFIAGAVFSQQAAPSAMYTQRGLEMLGLAADEIEEILRIQEEAAASIRRLHADQEVKKAELARLLMDEDPNMRLIERNLRETAEIEVDVRMVEIRREVAVRRIVGTERWARIIQFLRQRRDQAAQEIAGQAAWQFQQLQQAIAETQREITELIQGGREAIEDEEVRQLFQELARQSEELQRLMRERLQ